MCIHICTYTHTNTHKGHSQTFSKSPNGIKFSLNVKGSLPKPVCLGWGSTTLSDPRSNAVRGLSTIFLKENNLCWISFLICKTWRTIPILQSWSYECLLLFLCFSQPPPRHVLVLLTGPAIPLSQLLGSYSLYSLAQQLPSERSSPMATVQQPLSKTVPQCVPIIPSLIPTLQWLPWW